MSYKDYLYMYYCIQYTKELASGLPPLLGSVRCSKLQQREASRSVLH
jgi:hypothetical protein